MVADSFCPLAHRRSAEIHPEPSGSDPARRRLDQAVYNSLKTVISSMKQEDVISGRDSELAARITGARQRHDRVPRLRHRVLAIEIKRIDLPDENKAAVYERMNSPSAAIRRLLRGAGQRWRPSASATRPIRPSISRSPRPIRSLESEAAGEAEYMRILSEVYDTPEEADFLRIHARALDMAQKALVGGNKTLSRGPPIRRSRRSSPASGGQTQ